MICMNNVIGNLLTYLKYFVINFCLIVSLKDRNFETIELQCCMCSRWYHRECIEIDTGPLVRFMINYHFLCKKCNSIESFTKKQASFHQLCTTALANLICDAKGDESKSLFFARDRDIIPFIEKNWEAMTSAPRRTKSTWHATISRSMTRDDVFVTQENVTNEHLYSLRDHLLEKVGPFNENIKLVGTTNPAGVSIQASVPGNVLTNNTNSQNTNSSSLNSNRRGSKRKAANNEGTNIQDSKSTSGMSTKRRGLNDLARLEKMVPTCYPSEHPFNKDGYRYHLVEPDPNSPMRKLFEETEYWAGKPLPGSLYRVFLENKISLALHDRAPQLKMSDDRLSVTGDKGYSMVRATHGVFKGGWYFEVTIKDKPGNSAVRFGWAQKLANLQAPVGYDKFSYSWRSRKGTIFHSSIGKTYAKPGYDAGDVLGCYIYLPEISNKQLFDSNKQMTLVKFKNHLYYEEKDNFNEEEKRLTPLKGSRIEFFKNGVSCGVAFNDVYEGLYFPAISLYKNSSVSINFGPDFKYQPNINEKWKPVS